jgi:hypothetical protein
MKQLGDPYLVYLLVWSRFEATSRWCEGRNRRQYEVGNSDVVVEKCLCQDRVYWLSMRR